MADRFITIKACSEWTGTGSTGGAPTYPVNARASSPITAVPLMEGVDANEVLDISQGDSVTWAWEATSGSSWEYDFRTRVAALSLEGCTVGGKSRKASDFFYLEMGSIEDVTYSRLGPGTTPNIFLPGYGNDLAGNDLVHGGASLEFVWADPATGQIKIEPKSGSTGSSRMRLSYTIWFKSVESDGMTNEFYWSHDPDLDMWVSGAG